MSRCGRHLDDIQLVGFLSVSPAVIEDLRGVSEELAEAGLVELGAELAHLGDLLTGAAVGEGRERWRPVMVQFNRVAMQFGLVRRRIELAAVGGLLMEEVLGDAKKVAEVRTITTRVLPVGLHVRPTSVVMETVGLEGSWKDRRIYLVDTVEAPDDLADPVYSNLFQRDVDYSSILRSEITLKEMALREDQRDPRTGVNRKSKFVRVLPSVVGKLTAQLREEHIQALGTHLRPLLDAGEWIRLEEVRFDAGGNDSFVAKWQGQEIPLERSLSGVMETNLVLLTLSQQPVVLLGTRTGKKPFQIHWIIRDELAHHPSESMGLRIDPRNVLETFVETDSSRFPEHVTRALAASYLQLDNPRRLELATPVMDSKAASLGSLRDRIEVLDALGMDPGVAGEDVPSTENIPAEVAGNWRVKLLQLFDKLAQTPPETAADFVTFATLCHRFGRPLPVPPPIESFMDPSLERARLGLLFSTGLAIEGFGEKEMKIATWFVPTLKGEEPPKSWVKLALETLGAASTINTAFVAALEFYRAISGRQDTPHLQWSRPALIQQAARQVFSGSGPEKVLALKTLDLLGQLVET